MKYSVTVGDQTYEVGVDQDDQITFDNDVVDVDFAAVGEGGLYSLLVNNESFEAMVEERGHRLSDRVAAGQVTPKPTRRSSFGLPTSM